MLYFCVEVFVIKLIWTSVFLFCFLVIDSYSIFPQITKHNLNDVIWTGNQFVCVGDSGTILRSPDGKTWIPVSFTASNDLSSIVQLDTMFIIQSEDSSTYYLTDNLLRSFSARNSNILLKDVNFTYFKESIYYLNIFKYTTSSKKIMDLSSIARFSPQTGQSSLNEVWRPALKAPFFIVNSLASSSSRIVASGGYETTDAEGKEVMRPFLITSSDGVTWDTIKNPGIKEINRVLWAGDHFIGCGSDGMVFSEDGITWRPFIFRTYLSYDIYDGNVSYTFGFGKIIMSRLEQIVATGTAIPDTLYAYGVLSGEKERNINSTAISATEAIAVGNEGKIAVYSVSENKWKPCTTFLSTDLNAICYNNSVFVAVGDNGYMAVTPDGKLWDHSALIFRDTNLTSFPDCEYISLHGNITISKRCTSQTNVIIAPGTTLKIAPNVSMFFNKLIAIGNQDNFIRFQAQDTADWFGMEIVNGTLDYCAISGGTNGPIDSYTNLSGLLLADGVVSISNTSIITTPYTRFTRLIASGGSLCINRLNFIGNVDIIASSCSGVIVYNSLFQDSTRSSANSIQNNRPSSVEFVNCTFGRGCRMRASSDATQSVIINLRNCAFVDNLKAIKPYNGDYIYFNRCLGGDTLFENAVARNFHLRSNSTAIDGGLNDYISLTEDIDGNPRIFGKNVDVGAFEFNPGVVNTAKLTNKKASALLRIQGRRLILSLPEKKYDNCDLTFLNCTGQLLWNCQISSSSFKSGFATVTLPYFNRGMIFIRVSHHHTNEFRKVMIY